MQKLITELRHSEEIQEKACLHQTTLSKTHKLDLNKLECLPKAAQYCRHQQNFWEIHCFGKKILCLGYSDHHQEDVLVLIPDFPSNTALHCAVQRHQDAVFPASLCNCYLLTPFLGMEGLAKNSNSKLEHNSVGQGLVKNTNLRDCFQKKLFCNHY